MTIEERLSAIERRNEAVTRDKAWETSGLRRALIMVLTYLVVAVFLWTIGNPYPWRDSLVPVAGFFLSTLTVAGMKSWWLARRYPADPDEQVVKSHQIR